MVTKRTKKTKAGIAELTLPESMVADLPPPGPAIPGAPNPTYVFRFIVLARALKMLRETGMNPTSADIEVIALKVTGLRPGTPLEALEAGVRTLYDRMRTEGAIKCPNCNKHAVLPCLPEFAALQTDGTTHVCHFYLGGCDLGFELTKS